MSNSIETPIHVSLKEIKIKNWPELRRQNQRDFEVNLKPLFERLDEWRKILLLVDQHQIDGQTKDHHFKNLNL